MGETVKQVDDVLVHGLDPPALQWINLLSRGDNFMAGKYDLATSAAQIMVSPAGFEPTTL
jgi:hypothetical protein